MPLDREALVRPLAGEPSGEHLLYEGTYQRIKEAMTPSTSDAEYGIAERRVDWKEVAKLCASALEQRTKDLYIGCCLLEALARTEGARGLADGFWVLCELHERFWADFHPRPKERRGEVNINGRVNQLQALVQSLGHVLDGLPMNESAEPLTYFDWRYAGAKLPGGQDSPVSQADKDSAFASSSWDFYGDSVEAIKEAEAVLQRLSGLVRDKYGDSAISLAPPREALAELRGVFERLLEKKGPSPYQQQAERILQGTGFSQVDAAWLAPRLRKGLPEEVAWAALQGAAADAANGYRPDRPWTDELAAPWDAGRAYERKTKDPEPAEAAAAAAPAAQPSGAAPAAPPAYAPKAPVGGDPRGALLGACRALRLREPENPVPYVVTRLVRWAELDRVAPGTALPGPDARERQACAALCDAQQWERLLDHAESLLENGRGGAWLDLQRYATMAMGNRWDYAHDVRTAVIRTLRDLIARLDWIVDAKLADGTPVADATTRQWFATEVVKQQERTETAEPGSETAAANGRPPPEEQDRAQARKLAESNGMDAALGFLEQAARSARSARERAVRHVVLGEFCLEAGRPELARSVLERVRTEIRRRSLVDWEDPEFLGRALEALYGTYKLMAEAEPAGEMATRMREVADELAQVDLSRALRLGGGL